MTRSKRARRLARRAYAERRAGQPQRAVQQPTAKATPKKAGKQQPRRPFYARQEFIYSLYTVATIIAISLSVYWLYGRQKSATGEANQTPTVVSSEAGATSTAVSAARKQYSAPPPMAIDQNKTYFATIETEKGNIKAELFAKDAPKTVNNFVFLAREGFYDGLTFHRVLSNFVAQGGDPKGDGTGGPGYTIEDEFGTRKHLAGTLAMAHSDLPNSGGSQFYITFTPQPSLDGKYAVFGQVVEGMDVLQKLTPRDPDEKPTFPGDKIKKITIEEK